MCVCRCVLAFRGSDNFLDYGVTDASFAQEDPHLPGCDGCMLHSGFWDRWKEALKDKDQGVRPSLRSIQEALF